MHDLALVRRAELALEVLGGAAEQRRAAPRSRSSTSPRATGTPSGPAMSTGSPAWKVPGTPVTPAASSEARRWVTAATAPASRSRVPSGSVACASQSSRVGRRLPVAWKRVPTGSPASASADPLGGGEHDRDPGAGGDPGRLELGLHAAGAEPGRAGLADPHRGEVGRVAATSGTSALPGAPGSASYSPSTSESSTSRSAWTRCATSAASRSLSPNRISVVATVSFSLTIGSTPSSSSLAKVW